MHFDWIAILSGFAVGAVVALTGVGGGPLMTPPLNDVGDGVVELQALLPGAPFDANRVAGSLIVVDPASHRTSGALLARGGR